MTSNFFNFIYIFFLFNQGILISSVLGKPIEQKSKDSDDRGNYSVRTLTENEEDELFNQMLADFFKPKQKNPSPLLPTSPLNSFPEQEPKKNNPDSNKNPYEPLAPQVPKNPFTPSKSLFPLSPFVPKKNPQIPSNPFKIPDNPEDTKPKIPEDKIYDPPKDNKPPLNSTSPPSSLPVVPKNEKSPKPSETKPVDPLDESKIPDELAKLFNIPEKEKEKEPPKNQFGKEPPFPDKVNPYDEINPFLPLFNEPFPEKKKPPNYPNSPEDKEKPLEDKRKTPEDQKKPPEDQKEPPKDQNKPLEDKKLPEDKKKLREDQNKPPEDQNKLPEDKKKPPDDKSKPLENQPKQKETPGKLETSPKPLLENEPKPSIEKKPESTSPTEKTPENKESQSEKKNNSNQPGADSNIPVGAEIPVDIQKPQNNNVEMPNVNAAFWGFFKIRWIRLGDLIFPGYLDRARGNWRPLWYVLNQNIFR